MVSKLRNDNLSEDLAKTYELKAGTLFRKIQRNGKTRCLPIIPNPFRWSAVNNVHESIMHLGWEKTLEKMYEYYWFDKMSKKTTVLHADCQSPHLVGYKPNFISYRRLTSRGIQSTSTSQGSLVVRMNRRNT